MTPETARAVLHACGIHGTPDVCTLSFSTMCELADNADAHGYRKPRNANGSKGRYFYTYLLRILARARNAS